CCRLYILDCYTDPLGWKHQLVKSGIVEDVSPANLSAGTCIIQDVKDVDKLYSLILESGTDQISSIFWLLHSDIHEVKLTASLEYLSSMVTSVEPLNQPHDSYVRDLGSLSLDNSFGKGKLHTRFKRRNGRLRIMNEEIRMEESGIKFTSFSAEDGLVSQGLVPKVQFNLELSEKEKMERAKVVLPFEHQGTGKPIQIYDGRKSLAPEGITEAVAGDSQSKPQEESNGGGEIIYFRDSDDERPDSDEDPDDDLDI
ncbi:Elongator complex protein 5, partial [Linum perenne]